MPAGGSGRTKWLNMCRADVAEWHHISIPFGFQPNLTSRRQVGSPFGLTVLYYDTGAAQLAADDYSKGDGYNAVCYVENYLVV